MPKNDARFKTYAAELDALSLEAMTQGARIGKALDQLARPARAGEKSPREAFQEAKGLLNDYATARNAWKVKRDALYAAAKDDDKVLLKAVMDGADFKKNHANLTVEGLLAERFPAADAFLAALYPDQIDELRRVIPDLAKLRVSDFPNSIFADREMTLEFLESRKSLKKKEIQPAGALSHVKLVYAPKDIPAALERLGRREDGSLKPFEAELRVLVAESLPALEQWETALDGFERSVGGAKTGKRVNVAFANGERIIKTLTVGNHERQKKWTALIGKTPDPAIQSFLTAIYSALDANRASLSWDELIAQRFPNADALLAVLYPEYINELRRDIPDLKGLGTGDFRNSLFSDPELTLEFLENRKAIKKGDLKPAGALSQAQFAYASNDIPPLLARLASREDGTLKPYEAGLGALAAASMPILERLTAALDRLESAIRSGKAKGKLGPILSDINSINEEAKANAPAWQERRDALLEKATDPAVKSFLTAAAAALDPRRSNLDSVLSTRFRTADELLASLYPEDIAELRRAIPALSSMGVGGFEKSFFIDRESVIEFMASLRRAAESGQKPRIDRAGSLAEIPYLVAFEADDSKAKSGGYLLPYKVPGAGEIEELEPKTGAAELRPDRLANESKEKLRERFRTFDALIEANFRVLPMMGNLASKPKSVARAIVAEMGKMVASYAALTQSAGNPAEGEAASAKYDAIKTELESLWKDLPDGQPLSAELAARVGTLEKNADLPRLRNLHTLVNYMHKKSLKLLAGSDQGKGSGSMSSAGHSVVFTDLADEPLIREGRLRSAPLASLLPSLEALQSVHATGNDRMIINGDEAWYHAVLGKHTAEIYVKFAHPDDGGMLRVRYEDWETIRGKRPRMALLEAQLRGFGLSHEVEEDQFLTAVLDKDHGLNSESELREMFPKVIQALKEDSELNLYFEPMKPAQAKEMVDKMAELYLAEGAWPAKNWNNSSAFPELYKTYADAGHLKVRASLRLALDKELRRLGLPPIPEDLAFGQAVIRRFFTDAVQKGLATGQLRLDKKGLPQVRDYKPVEELADAVLADAGASRRLGSLARGLSAQLEFEPIGAVGALRAERAILKLGRGALVVYVLRDPETGFIGYARAQSYVDARITELSAAGLTAVLARQGLEVPAAEDMSEAQAEYLDGELRSPGKASALLGERTLGLAASPGRGGFVTARAAFDKGGKPGAVLIVPFTDPDDLNAMRNAAAVVTTGGGLLSHAAITTRELGVASVIVPGAAWKKNTDGTDSVEIALYTPEGETVSHAGLSLTPRLAIRRYRVLEGDFVRVNGATGELSLFPERGEDVARALAFVERGGDSKASLSVSAAGFAIEEALFGADSEGDPQAAIAGKILRHKDAAVRGEARRHARRLLEEVPAGERFKSVAKLLGVKTPAGGERPAAAIAAVRDAVLPARKSAVRRVERRAMAPAVLPLGAVDDGDRALVGGKFSKLGEILAVVRAEGAYVPEALSVTTEGYARFLEENGLADKIKALAGRLDAAQVRAKTAAEQTQVVAEYSAKIRAVIRSGKLNPESGLGAEIWKGMQDHGLAGPGTRLAVRSSAVQEDQADAAFAGAAETYLNIKPEEALERIVENWASFWLPRGILYRQGRAIASAELRPSTIIQQMAEADVAGVIFTRNPVTGGDEIVVNAAYGLGEGIVSGLVQTDRYVMRKSDGQETRLPFVGDKRIAVRPTPDGSNTELRGVPKADRNRRSLTLAQTTRLARIAKALEEHFGYALDIEFAISGDRIAILQARPVTTRGAKPSAPVKEPVQERVRPSAEAAAPAKDLGSVLDAARPEEFHARALAHWKRDYRPEHLMATIKALADGDRAHLDSGAKTALKALRKDASRLEGVFEMFDERHHVPGDFGYFVGTLGDLNDSLDDGKDEEAGRKAKSLRAWLEGRAFDARVGEFKPADRRSTYERLARTADSVRSALRKEKFSDHEFHHVRLQMKNYTFLLYLLSDIRPDDRALRALSSELTSLNSEMGGLRDKKRQAGDDGYDFPMPPEFRARILKFLDSFLPAPAKTTA
ncbi:MAG: PEP/pyruvate-binding domain-containing protein [Elusimicrobiota bacterium]